MAFDMKLETVKKGPVTEIHLSPFETAMLRVASKMIDDKGSRIGANFFVSPNILVRRAPYADVTFLVVHQVGEVESTIMELSLRKSGGVVRTTIPIDETRRILNRIISIGHTLIWHFGRVYYKDGDDVFIMGAVGDDRGKLSVHISFELPRHGREKRWYLVDIDREVWDYLEELSKIKQRIEEATQDHYDTGTLKVRMRYGGYVPIYDVIAYVTMEGDAFTVSIPLPRGDRLYLITSIEEERYTHLTKARFRVVVEARHWHHPDVIKKYVLNAPSILLQCAQAMVAKSRERRAPRMQELALNWYNVFSKV